MVVGGGQGHRHTLFGILLPSCPVGLYDPGLRRVPRSALFEGHVKLRGCWFGSAHGGGREQSSCVVGMMEEENSRRREEGNKEKEDRITRDKSTQWMCLGMLLTQHNLPSFCKDMPV